MKRAFTLVELLVVVGIIALLAAILFPVFSQARAMAHRTACASNIHQIAVAEVMYAQDFDDALPFWYLWQGSNVLYWTDMLCPYLREDAVYRCPAVSRGREPDPDLVRLADYAYYSWGPGGVGSVRDPHWLWPGSRHEYAEHLMHLSEVMRPSESFSLMDGYTGYDFMRGYLPGYSNIPWFRHGPDGVNAGFLDGHSRWLTLWQTEKIAHDNQGWFYVFCAADR